MKTLTVLLLSAAALASAGCASRGKLAAAPSLAATQLQAGPATTPPPRSGERSTDVARGSQADLAAAAGDRVFFAFDSDDLDLEARAMLQRQARWLSENAGVRARIAGNADERGTREYNLALGARRASAARQFLIGQGVSSARLETISYGKEQPIEAGSDDEAWARNRNAQTVVIGLASW